MSLARNRTVFDRTIKIQSKSSTSSDTTINYVETWTTIATIKASVQAKLLRENVQGEQIVALRSMMFKIRYRTDVDETCRIEYLGKHYDIQSIEELGRKQFLMIEGIKR